jgi:hypothetical protein
MLMTVLFPFRGRFGSRPVGAVVKPNKKAAA